MYTDRPSNNVDNKSKKKRKQQQLSRKSQRWRHPCSTNPAASWTRTTTTIDLSKKAGMAHNPAPASIARRVAMDIPNRDTGATSVVSSIRVTILSRCHLISISRASSMSQGVRVMMICGEMNTRACKLFLSARTTPANAHYSAILREDHSTDDDGLSVAKDMVNECLRCSWRYSSSLEQSCGRREPSSQSPNVLNYSLKGLSVVKPLVGRPTRASQ